jgi:hypothetical protein
MFQKILGSCAVGIPEHCEEVLNEVEQAVLFGVSDSVLKLLKVRTGILCLRKARAASGVMC